MLFAKAGYTLEKSGAQWTLSKDGFEVAAIRGDDLDVVTELLMVASAQEKGAQLDVGELRRQHIKVRGK